MPGGDKPRPYTLFPSSHRSPPREAQKFNSAASAFADSTPTDRLTNNS